MIKKTTENTRKRRLANPEKYKETLRKQKHTRLKREYGITSDEWWKMFEEQDCRCKICKSNTTAGKGWHTDHCHTSNKVRGILCYHCNLLLGMAKDDVEVLSKAIEYLNTQKEIETDE